MEVTLPTMLSDLTQAYDNLESVKVLVTTFIDEKEICKKILHVSSAKDIIGQSQAQHMGCVLDRLLKYNTDFMEYIDVDNEVDVKDFDRFHIFLSARGPPMETSLGEIRQNQSTITTEEQSQPLRSLLKRKAPQILKEYETTGTLSVPSRKLLVKTCIGDLVERCGYYPLSAEKLTVAKSIITTFPSLSVRVAGQGEGFEHYYDPVSHCGFLETKLRNLRRNLDQGQRRYKKRKVTNDCGEDKKLRQEDGNTSSTDEWVTLIKRLRPSAENLPTIMSGMEETYTSRRAWISKDSPTAAEIFREYPRFLDLPSLLDLEFGKLTGGKADLFLRKWEASIIPKLKSVAALETRMSSLLKDFEEKTEDEACYTALVVLTHLLPPVGASRCSLKSAITHLVDFALPGTSIASLCSDPEASSTTHQPQLICIGDLKSATRQYIIVAKNDKVTIPLNDGLTCAVDKLFKLYWVCNLSYPAPLGSVFTFFEFVYDLPLSTQRKTKVLELIAQIKACK
ncbi:uncharacterized protein LOC120723321 [Simochromis diagramma]|uniref:uncharacterized protein LOC120715925 n=1 Tax=Simochromis diagramma TaxID=43689 RepID=UPI001A7EF006|nr:uncharacterized protein LOC120715925 [Simochromis diagramma]XP_039870644.1 uncharacterized protein LOC120723321 [Simochromis diagramma]